MLFVLFPTVFLGLFTRDPEVHRLGVPYLRILALCLVVNGVEIVIAEAILGSGHTTAISWIFTMLLAAADSARVPGPGVDGHRRARDRVGHHRHLHRARRF